MEDKLLTIVLLLALITKIVLDFRKKSKRANYRTSSPKPFDKSFER